MNNLIYPSLPLKTSDVSNDEYLEMANRWFSQSMYFMTNKKHLDVSPETVSKWNTVARFSSESEPDYYLITQHYVGGSVGDYSVKLNFDMYGMLYVPVTKRGVKFTDTHIVTYDFYALTYVARGLFGGSNHVGGFDFPLRYISMKERG